MRYLTIPSSAIALRSEKALTPAMVSAVWEIAAKLDEDRIPTQVPNSVWVEMPTKRLRGDGGRADNVWLRECLERLTEIKLSGEHNGDPWGAVLLAAWEITQGGSVARLLVPPPGIQTLRVPATFAKIEAQAAHRLTGHGRRLYAILADKKRLRRQHWTFSLDEIKTLMGVHKKPTYQRYNAFRQYVLTPAVAAINDYGTVSVKMTPEKLGRSVVAVRFDWDWKDPWDATETVVENDKHSKARRKTQDTEDAPPMIEEEEEKAPDQAQEQPLEPALAWWKTLSQEAQNTWADAVGRTVEQVGPGGSVITTRRRNNDIARAAFAAHEYAAPSGDLDPPPSREDLTCSGP